MLEVVVCYVLAAGPDFSAPAVLRSGAADLLLARPGHRAVGPAGSPRSAGRPHRRAFRRQHGHRRCAGIAPDESGPSGRCAGRGDKAEALRGIRGLSINLNYVVIIKRPKTGV